MRNIFIYLFIIIGGMFILFCVIILFMFLRVIILVFIIGFVIVLKFKEEIYFKVIYFIVFGLSYIKRKCNY